MRNFLLFVLLSMGFGAKAQWTLSFVNPEIIGTTKYRATLRMTATTTMGLGATNFRLNYPFAIIANPILVANSFTGLAYGATSFGGSQPLTGYYSINTSYNGNAYPCTSASCIATYPMTTEPYNNTTGATGALIITPTGTNICTVEWDILDLSQITAVGNAITIRVTNPKTAIVDDDRVTAVNLTAAMTTALTPLPIELLFFTGKSNGEVNSLRWETAMEENVARFAVERSTDGVNNFREVATVKATGNSKTKVSYSADDTKPLSMGYYRLLSVDNDGTKNYSKVITIDRRNKKFAVVEVTPNPTTDAIRVNFDVKTKGEVSVSLTDALGRVVMTQNQATVAGNNNLSLDMSSLATGTYFLSLSDGANTTVERVVKQ